MSDSCEIIVKGILDADWSEWLEGLAITHKDQEETIISGPIRDQAALYGLFAKMGNMALFIVSVRYITGEAVKHQDDQDFHS